MGKINQQEIKMYYERKEAGTKLVAFSHKVLVFEEKTDHDVCVAIQGEIPLV